MAAGGKGCCSLFNWLLVAAFLLVVHVYHNLFSNKLLAVVPEHVDHFSIMEAAMNSTTAIEYGGLNVTEGALKDESPKSLISKNDSHSSQNSNADNLLISGRPDLKDSARKSTIGNITSDISSQNITPETVVVISAKPQEANVQGRGPQESSSTLNTTVANSQKSQSEPNITDSSIYDGQSGKQLNDSIKSSSDTGLVNNTSTEVKNSRSETNSTDAREPKGVEYLNASFLKSPVSLAFTKTSVKKNSRIAPNRDNVTDQLKEKVSASKGSISPTLNQTSAKNRSQSTVKKEEGSRAKGLKQNNASFPKALTSTALNQTSTKNSNRSQSAVKKSSREKGSKQNIAPKNSISVGSADTQVAALPFIDPPRMNQSTTSESTKPIFMLCKACKEARINKDLTCVARIKKLIGDGNTLRAAQTSAAKKYPECSSCLPLTCPSKLDREVGFDVAAPKQVWGTTPTLMSLPHEYRVPQHVIENNQTASYFQNWPNGSYILHTYNPSLIPAPAALTANLTNASYLAIFRLSPLQTCAPEFYPYYKYRELNLYGLAVLDGGLQILRDTIVDINSHMNIDPKKPQFDDIRIQDLQGDVYLTNGRRLLPIEVTTTLSSQSIPNLFGNKGLHLRNLTALKYISNIPKKFKNSHIFEDSSKNLMLEYWPEGPHEVYPIQLSSEVVNASEKLLRKELPDSSFLSHERFLGRNPYIMSRARGSACCLKLYRHEYQDLLPRNHSARQLDYLLVGVSHAKSQQFEKGGTAGLYLYLSRLYAFSPISPFPIIARSGFFCLPDVDEPSQDPHVLFQQEPNNQLVVRGRHYKCPRVHFVSGIAESVTNSSEIIVAYGINDCVPRLVVLEKRSVLQRLFLTILESEKLIFDPSKRKANGKLHSEQSNNTGVMLRNISTAAVVRSDDDVELPYIDPPRVTLPNRTDGLLPKLCAECWDARISEKLTCEARITKLIRDGYNLSYALTNVASNYLSCSSCGPSMCPAKLDREVGFDTAAPKQLWGTTPTLKSLPHIYRIPQHVIEDNQTASYFQNWRNGSYILHTYNPSLIPAPAALRARLTNATYLAVFRLSPLQTCLPTFYPFYMYKELNLLGVAVLDGRLQILRDTIVDINAYIGSKRPDFEDIRILNVQGVVYLSNGRRLLPIEVTTTPSSKSMPNLFGNKGLYIKNQTRIQVIKRIPRTFKNSHLFEDTSKNLFLDYWPEGPHEVRPIWFFDRDKVKSSDAIISNDFPDPSFASHDRLLGTNPYAMSRARGSACCLKVYRHEYQGLLPQNHSALELDYILVGISHSKSTPFERSGQSGLYLYLSRMYAFAPVSPFRTIARSGFFCLSDVDEPSQDPHILFQRDPVNRLSIKGRRYKCPRVQFISGMTESVTNSSEVIVAYGINDCVPRMVVLEKRSILQRLFLTIFESEIVV